MPGWGGQDRHRPTHRKAGPCEETTLQEEVLAALRNRLFFIIIIFFFFFYFYFVNFIKSLVAHFTGCQGLCWDNREFSMWMWRKGDKLAVRSRNKTCPGGSMLVVTRSNVRQMEICNTRSIQ